MLDWSDCPLVETDPARMHGIPIVKGTRMPADDVVENYESGSPVQEIAENFGLDPQDIRAILSYAATHTPAQPVR
jgi:uncharacterized protein (DUF433 family)